MVLSDLLVLTVFTFILYKSSEIVVENASKLSIFFGISKMALGMILVAVSTSLPELAISIISSVENHGGIAVGNVFGSNISNILLILGLGALLFGFEVEKSVLKDILLALALTTIISVYIIAHSMFYGNALGLIEGIILLCLFIWFSFSIVSKKNPEFSDNNQKIKKIDAANSFLWFFTGIIIVLLSSTFVVKSAVNLAAALGIAQSFIGATIIAVGTSLPELSIDLQAIRKKHYGLAIGDALGSNVANLTLVLGTAAVIHEIGINLSVFIAALLFAIIANITFLVFSIVKKRFDRKEGAMLIAIYVFYIVTIFILQAHDVLHN